MCWDPFVSVSVASYPFTQWESLAWLLQCGLSSFVNNPGCVSRRSVSGAAPASRACTAMGWPQQATVKAS